MFPFFYIVIFLLSFVNNPTNSLHFVNNIANSINNTPATIATYVWDTKTIDTHTDEYLGFAVKNVVTDIYLQYSSDLTKEEYREFIISAHDVSVDIHLLHGSPEWVYSQNDVLLSDMLDWLDSYQKSSSKKANFDGIHLDIEYYLLDLNKKETKNAISQYQERILSAKNFCEENNIELSSSIPFWFDNVELSKNSNYNNLAEWTISNVDNTVLMAYRNSVLGSNAILDIVEDELTYASKNNEKVIIGLETRRSNEGDHLSFYGLDESVLTEFMSSVNFHLQNEPSFNGFAIHHLETWIELKSNESKK